MNIRAVITTTEIAPMEHGYSCELQVNGAWSGDLWRPTREELQSLCDHIKTKTNVK